MTVAGDLLRRQIVRQLGHLIEITRVIDRNREDGIFAREQDRRILYVFDTNVIQMFLEPSRNPQFAETFHGALWGDRQQQRDEINAQSCLLAAEFLMSGTLPGQGDNGVWYMSDAHRSELTQQIGYLNTEIEAIDRRLRTDDHYRAAALNQMEALNAALEFGSDPDRSYVLKLAQKSGLSEADLRGLDALDDDAFDQRAIGIRSREVSRLLALDRIIEPRDQLRRYRSREMSGTRQSLEMVIGMGARHRADIRREANLWYQSFAQALLTRAPGTRSEASLRADCETMALVEWAGRNLPSDKRIVFVTGDKLLLDAYKKRYIDRLDAGPFLLRPINYFAPLFNPTSAHSYLPAEYREAAFLKLQEALEGAMVALNLGLLSEQDPQYRLRARDHFSFSVETDLDWTIETLSALFPNFFEADRLAKQDGALRALVAELRTLELLLLEAYPHLVAERLVEQQEAFLSYNKNIGSAIDQGIGSGLTRARSAGLKLSQVLMPRAVTILLGEIQNRADDWPERAVIPTRLSFSGADTYLDYATEIRRLTALSAADLGKVIARLNRRPPMIFALAAMLAFSLEFWRDAARYSNLAVTASTEMPGLRQSGSDEEDHYECLYMAAVSQRFRLAAWEPAPSLGFTDPWQEWPTFALDALGKCVEYHTARGELAREIRALSERASLNVSHCEWLIFGDDRLLADVERREGDAIALLVSVVADLTRCDELYPEAVARAEQEQRKGRNGSTIVVSAVAKQFRYNVLAAELARETIALRWPAHAELVNELKASLPQKALVDWPGMPEIAKAYLAASRNDTIALAEVDFGRVSLSLDAVIIRGLARLLDLRAQASRLTS